MSGLRDDPLLAGTPESHIREREIAAAQVDLSQRVRGQADVRKLEAFALLACDPRLPFGLAPTASRIQGRRQMGRAIARIPLEPRCSRRALDRLNPLRRPTVIEKVERGPDR